MEEMLGGTRITYQGTELNFTPPWPRVDSAKVRSSSAPYSARKEAG